MTTSVCTICITKNHIFPGILRKFSTFFLFYNFPKSIFIGINTLDVIQFFEFCCMVTNCSFRLICFVSHEALLFSQITLYVFLRLLDNFLESHHLRFEQYHNVIRMNCICSLLDSPACKIPLPKKINFLL